MDSKIIKLFIILSFITVKSQAVEFKGKFIQGHFILGKTEKNSKVFIDRKEIKVTKDGYFVFGLGRDRKYDVVIDIYNSGENKKIVKKIQKRKYNIQRIDGLEEKKVTHNYLQLPTKHLHHGKPQNLSFYTAKKTAKLCHAKFCVKGKNP